MINLLFYVMKYDFYVMLSLFYVMNSYFYVMCNFHIRQKEKAS